MHFANVVAAFAVLTTHALGQETVLDALNDLNSGSVPSIEEVQSVFDTLYAQACPRFPDAPIEEPQSFDIRFRYASDDVAQPERLMELYQFHCYSGAYNVIYVFFAWDSDAGLRPVALSHPQLDIAYETETDDSPVKSIAITGYSARFTAVNAEYDSKTKTITSGSLWRGVGDASSGGTWVFDAGEFVLQTYEVDATYDGESNPKTIVDFAKPQMVK